MAGVARAAGDGLAANLALVVAGKKLPSPSTWSQAGENGWQRLLRTVPDAELHALAALPRDELAALAASLGGSLDENEP